MIFFPEQTPLSETVLGRTREGNEITEYAWGEGERQILFLSGFAAADAPLGRALLTWAKSLARCEKESGILHGFDLKNMKSRRRIRLIPHLDPTTANINRNGINQNRQSQNLQGIERNQRLNARGVDLNRNFNANWLKMRASSPDKYACGPFPESERETSVLTENLKKNLPCAALILQEGAEGIFYPEEATAKEIKEAFFLGRYASVPVHKDRDCDGTVQQWLTDRGTKVLTLRHPCPDPTALQPLFSLCAALT